ncbi:deaminase domain-containing protein [Thermogemmatispora sp.]|uniref:deaminase domain-containing protein n=1 Tax=Thermogemmatispora sp. TaxID=1968838 RepID=UPI001D85AB75|nr:deaminase domain-containing protein [Thermogemmatispora sp.]MBX5450405.1 hypothetical protein [Thermogemmatispora sp.]
MMAGSSQSAGDRPDPWPRRNWAFAEYELGPGQRGTLVAESSLRDLPGTVPTPAPEARYFFPIRLAHTVGTALHEADAEDKLLNELARRFNPRREPVCSVKARVHLYSERQPCSACEDLIRQFRRMFPHVELTVNYDFEPVF